MPYREKYVHQIWFQGEKFIPEKYIQNINNTKKILNGWKYIFWDNQKIKKFLMERNLRYLNKYNEYKLMHQKIDIAKYMILYYYGGIYIDMDAYAVKDPSYLFEEYPFFEVFVSSLEVFNYEKIMYLQFNEIVNNGIILSIPKSSLMLDLIENCPHKFISLSNTVQINYTTGPAIFSKFVAKNNKTKILPKEYFEPLSHTKRNITDKTIIIHEHSISWMEDKIKFMFQKYLKYRNNIRIIIYTSFLLSITISFNYFNIIIQI